jgi:hypothetical protein
VGEWVSCRFECVDAVSWDCRSGLARLWNGALGVSVAGLSRSVTANLEGRSRPFAWKLFRKQHGTLA